MRIPAATTTARWVLLLVVVTGACVADDETSRGAGTADDRQAIDASAVAIAADPTGGFYWAELEGTVHAGNGQVIATLDVDREGQRGLVGLAVDDEGTVFVGYVASDLRLTVAALTPEGEPRLVWRGPETVSGGNGGRILFDRDGRLVVGVGLLNDRSGQADPADATGKLVAIDPQGDPDQEPEILSGPWNNPFAIAQLSNGELWVADNHPSDGEERLARGDDGLSPFVAAVLPNDSAPTGMAAVRVDGPSEPSEELWVCTYNTRLLLRYVRSGAGWQQNGVVARDCLLDVATLSDGRIAYSTGEEIVLLDPVTADR